MKRIIEVITVTIILVAVVRILHINQHIPFIGSYYATIFAVLFLYVPAALLWFRKLPFDFLDNSPKQFLRGALFFLLWVMIIFPPFLVCAHFWETIVYGKQGFYLAPFPDFWKTIAFQVLLIALPEEFFFRGYMQGMLGRVFVKKWKLFGASLGWAWPVTAVVFAFSHSFVTFQWWHFSIFFPALLFGWLREKTGSITAPILFHAMSNIVSDYVARCYY